MATKLQKVPRMIWLQEKVDLPQVHFQTPTNKRESKPQQNQSEGKKEERGDRLVGFAQSWILMRRFVRRRFSFVPSFLGNRPVGSLMKSKMEDAINQSSNYNLKFRSIFILIQPNPRVPQRSKFWLPPYSNKLINIHDSANPTSLFSCLLLFGPADRFPLRYSWIWLNENEYWPKF